MTAPPDRTLVSGDALTDEAMERSDVAIVGYGPVGQVLSALLGRQGHRVVALERHPGLYPLPRAAHLDGETMRTLQGAGIAEEFYPKIHRQRGYAFLDADHALMHQLDFSGDDGSGWGPGFFFGPDLEALLHEEVGRHPEVEVRFASTVVGLACGDTEVQVRVEHAPRLRARYVVGADGANSTVRALAGIESTDLDYSAQWLVVDVRPLHPEATRLLPEAAQILDPRRPVSAFRWIGHEHARLEFMLLPGELPEVITRDDEVWRLLSPWGLEEGNASLIRQTVYTFRSQLAERFDAGRILLAGDAAHLMPPFLGQGMCSGIRDAAALAWRLDQALRAAPGPALFGSYTAERRRHVQAVIDGSIAIGRILGATPETAGESRTAPELTASLSQLPAGLPPLQDGAIALGSPLAGTLLPQLTVRDHHASAPVRFDDRTGRTWRLIVHAELADPHSQQLLGWRTATVSDPWVLGAGGFDVDGGYARWLEATAPGVLAVIVRPDSIIFGAAQTAGELAGLIAAVRHYVGPPPD